MSKYRLLKKGGIIKADDEVLTQDAVTWKLVAMIMVGDKYIPQMLAMRRKIEGEPAPEQKKVTVRMAVVIDPKTWEYNACGWSLELDSRGDRAKLEYASNFFPGRNLQHAIVEAVIPITEPPVIVGTVTEGE